MVFIFDGDGNATINCSTANNNSVYGINTNLGGILTLNGDTTSSNRSGGYYPEKGTLVLNSNCHSSSNNKSSLPLNIINVTGGGSNPLDCTDCSCTELVLQDGDYALLPCPASQAGIIAPKTNSNLPGSLDSKYTFVSSFDIEVNPSLTGASMTASFKIPAGKQNDNFTILHWDGTKWVSMGGSINPLSFFSLDTNLTDAFVLVTQ